MDFCDIIVISKGIILPKNKLTVILFPGLQTCSWLLFQNASLSLVLNSSIISPNINVAVLDYIFSGK